MRTNHIIKINARGGIFTPAKLKQIVEIAFKFGAKTLNVGPRQELYFNIHKEQLADFVKKSKKESIDYEVDTDTYPNIVSSYPAEGIFSGDYWLSEGIYKDIFDQFDFSPKLKINICDSDQSLIPFFSGELNFIASPSYQYWFLYLNFKEDKKLICWPTLIYSTDLAKVSREIEELYFNNGIKNTSEIISLIEKNATYLTQNYDKELTLPRYVFPYYEGLTKYGNNFWLGLYRRDYQFPIPFIHELCEMCNETRIGQICTTTWRTIIIKGIENNNRILWEKLLGKHGINLRHSTTELNWIVEDINSTEVDLKKYLISQFDEMDVRTFGLVFGIKLQSSNFIPASVIIEEVPFFHKDELKLLSSYNIYHTENFNPNSPNKILFAKNVRKTNLLPNLLKICQLYFSNLNDLKTNVSILEKKIIAEEIKKTKVHVCPNCFTVYDSQFGDPFVGVLPGTIFENLPASYECFTCSTSKHQFEEKILEEIEIKY
jgi:rubredoxin